MTPRRLLLLSLLFCFMATNVLHAQHVPPRPNPPRLVNDFTHTLTADQEAALEKKLRAFDDSTSTQIAVVLLETLNGMDVSDLALKIGRSWGVGGKKYNNGVVFLIAIKDKKMNISTGYGAEGALPDVTAKHIIRDVVAPNFKGKDYYRGIDEGTTAITKALKGEYKAPPRKKKDGSSLLGFLLFIGIIVLVFMFRSGGGGGGQYMSRRGSRGYMGPMFFPGGGWGSNSSGGGSGGGFGGFGGGSFGGGGASGDW